MRSPGSPGNALRGLARWLLRALLAVLLGAVALVVVALVLPHEECSERNRVRRAQFDVQRIATDGVEAFRKLHGRYPTNEEGLAILIGGKLMKANAPDGTYRDPWGRAYAYECPGRIHPDSFDVRSYGADGKPGGDDGDAWNE